MLPFIIDLRDWIATNLLISADTQANLLSSLAVVISLWLLKWLVMRLVLRRVSDLNSIYTWRKTTDYLALALGIVIVGRIWFEGVGPVATYLGLLSAGLAIALQDLITNIVGWAFILTRRPFEVGDRIEIGNHAGDVVDIRFFQFTLPDIRGWVDADQSTGRVLHMPNRLVFTQPIASFTKGLPYLWHEIGVEVTFESDWKKAKELLRQILAEHAPHVSEAAREQMRTSARRYQIQYNTFTPTVYTTVTPSGVLLTMRYLVEPRKRHSAQEQVWEAVLRTFARHADIDLAYPTQRIYYRPGDEGLAADDLRLPRRPHRPPVS